MWSLTILLLSIYILSVASLQLDLNPGEVRCVGQQLDQEDAAIFFIGGNTQMKKTLTSQRVVAVVTDPNEERIIDERIIIGNRAKEYQRDITIRGVYEMCFEHQDGDTPVRIYFHVDFKSRAAEAMALAKKLDKDSLPALELQLKAAEDILSDISKEYEFATRQEILLREAQDGTDLRIHRFGILSISILAFTSLWQLLYLRRYFTSKKLL